MVPLFAEVKMFRFWAKTMDYSPWFRLNFFMHSHNSSLEGAMKLKLQSFFVVLLLHAERCYAAQTFGHSASLEIRFLHDIMFWRGQKFEFLASKHGL